MRTVLLLLAALAVAPALAQQNLFIQSPRPTHENDRTRVEIDALFTVAPPSGYLPVRVEIVNQRRTDGAVRLFASSASSATTGEDGAMESEFELESEAGTARTHDVLVPLVTDLAAGSGYGGASVNLSMTGSFGSNSGSIQSGFNPHGPAILLSEPLHTPNSSKLDAELNSRGGHSYGSHSFAARFEPSRMPEDWRAYVGYDALMATDRDWLAMSPGARNAILQWCRLGRELVLYRVGGGGAGFDALDIEGEADGDEMQYGLGHIELARIEASHALDPAATVNRFHGSGAAFPPLLDSITDDYSGGWPLHERFGEQGFEYGIFIVVLIAFGVLVGPVNLFVFAKSGKRHKLFITTPIISLGTSAVLILLILVKDGVGGRGTRLTLMEVRPGAGENRAYVIQEQISRTGVLLGTAFDLEEDAAISPVPISPGPWARLTPANGGGGMRYTADFEEGDLAVSGDWFQSRSEQGQLVQAVVPTRGRIELRGDAGRPVLASTFGFPIDTIYYVDRSGGHWRARDLDAGDPVTCERISESAYRAAVNAEANRFAGRQQRLAARAVDRRGHFVAVSAEAPAVETFDAISWRDDHTVITGPVAR